MEYRKFPQGYALRLDPGEEVVECLTRLVDREHVQLGTVSALGAANDVTIGIYDTAEKKYYSKRYQGQFEISALVGNVTRQEGKPYLHLHITIGSTATRRPGRSMPATCPPVPSAPPWSCFSRCGTGRLTGSSATRWG